MSNCTAPSSVPCAARACRAADSAGLGLKRIVVRWKAAHASSTSCVSTLEKSLEEGIRCAPCTCFCQCVFVPVYSKQERVFKKARFTLLETRNSRNRVARHSTRRAARNARSDDPIQVNAWQVCPIRLVDHSVSSDESMLTEPDRPWEWPAHALR
jgi:hypothetical protein